MANEEIKFDDDPSAKKLTDWKKEPSLLDLKNDLMEALPDHKAHVTKVKNWLDNLRVTGSAKPKKIAGKSNVQPKLIRKQAEWRYAALSEPFLSTEDIFNTEPVTHEDKLSSIQNGLILNNQFNTKIDKVAFIDEYVRTAVDEGTICCRVGWYTEEEEQEVEVPIIEYTPNLIEEALIQEQQLHELMETSPDEYAALPEEIKGAHDLFMETGIPYIGTITGIEIEIQTVTVENKPTVEVCAYDDIIVDPTPRGDQKKIQFIIYRFETSKSDLEKSNTNYVNLDNIKLTNESPLSQSDTATEETTTFVFNDEPRKKMVAYEYWGFYDIHDTGMTVPIVVTWVGDTIIRMEENPFPDKELPFVFIQYLPVRKSLYGEPDGELLEDNQKIVGAVTRGMIDIMGRSANGQIGFRSDALDVTNKRRYNNGQDYEFNPNIDPKAAIITHVYPEIPQSAQIMLGNQNADAESLTGVKSFSQEGITGRALGDTVGGQKNALDASSLRKLGILRRLADGMKKIGRKVMAMNTEFLSEEEAIRITNRQFITIRRDDLSSKSDITLSISTAEADNEKAQELAFMLQTMGNNMNFNISKMILADIARLRKMPALAKNIEDFTPQPDPLEQQKLMLEIELLKAQVMNETAKGQENAVDVDLKKAKTETERAKTRGLHSEADKADLEFLEEEQGIPHQRELEKEDAKRLAALDLKAADSLLPSTNTN
jgi:hypothetical protein